MDKIKEFISNNIYNYKRMDVKILLILVLSTSMISQLIGGLLALILIAVSVYMLGGMIVKELSDEYVKLKDESAENYEE